MLLIARHPVSRGSSPCRQQTRLEDAAAVAAAVVRAEALPLDLTGANEVLEDKAAARKLWQESLKPGEHVRRVAAAEAALERLRAAVDDTPLKVAAAQRQVLAREQAQTLAACVIEQHRLLPPFERHCVDSARGVAACTQRDAANDAFVPGLGAEALGDLLMAHEVGTAAPGFVRSLCAHVLEASAVARDGGHAAGVPSKASSVEDDAHSWDETLDVVHLHVMSATLHDWTKPAGCLTSDDGRRRFGDKLAQRVAEFVASVQACEADSEDQRDDQRLHAFRHGGDAGGTGANRASEHEQPGNKQSAGQMMRAFAAVSDVDGFTFDHEESVFHATAKRGVSGLEGVVPAATHEALKKLGLNDEEGLRKVMEGFLGMCVLCSANRASMGCRLFTHDGKNTGLGVVGDALRAIHASRDAGTKCTSLAAPDLAALSASRPDLAPAIEVTTAWEASEPDAKPGIQISAGLKTPSGFNTRDAMSLITRRCFGTPLEGMVPFSHLGDFKDFLRQEGIKSAAECAERWHATGSDLRTSHPASPRRFHGLFAHEIFETDRKHNISRHHRPFAQAAECVRSLEFSNMEEWRAWAKSEHRPRDVPANPNIVHTPDEGWRGCPHWLGHERKRKRCCVWSAGRHETLLRKWVDGPENIMGTAATKKLKEKFADPHTHKLPEDFPGDQQMLGKINKLRAAKKKRRGNDS